MTPYSNVSSAAALRPACNWQVLLEQRTGRPQQTQMLRIAVNVANCGKPYFRTRRQMHPASRSASDAQQAAICDDIEIARSSGLIADVDFEVRASCWRLTISRPALASGPLPVHFATGVIIYGAADNPLLIWWRQNEPAALPSLGDEALARVWW